MKRCIIADSKGWFLGKESSRSLKDIIVFTISSKEDLSLERMQAINPEYIFFVHWNWIVSEEIYKRFNCVVFHTAPLPYGRGGSPIQNLIIRGFKSSPVCAIKMTGELDAGPIYLQKNVSLEGRLDEIFERISKVITQLILQMCNSDICPKEQEGLPTNFLRLTREQNKINFSEDLNKIYDAIRMVDGLDYPRAYIEEGNCIVEFSTPEIVSDVLFAKAKIYLQKNKVSGKLLNSREKLSFMEVDPTNILDVVQLYELLGDRTYGISHHQMPEFKEHVEFVKNNPYLKWYLIKSGDQCIGNVYILPDNCIGINLKKDSQHLTGQVISFVKDNHQPLPAVKSVRSDKFFVNVASDDNQKFNALEASGAKIIQSTFLI